MYFRCGDKWTALDNDKQLHTRQPPNRPCSTDAADAYKLKEVVISRTHGRNGSEVRIGVIYATVANEHAIKLGVNHASILHFKGDMCCKEVPIIGAYSMIKAQLKIKTYWES